MENKIKLGKLEINLDELRAFIAKAKKNCYAGGGEEQVMPDGSKRLIFQDGDFWYEDNYAGWYQAPGRELVKWKREDGQRIWQMSYSGGMENKYIGDGELTKKTFSLLKRVLLQVTPEKPFRGPDDSRSIYGGSGAAGDLIYHNVTNGDITRFKGEETIHLISDKYPLLFSQDYIGGLVIQK